MKYLTVGYQIDKRRETKKGFPVKLRITHFGQPRYYDIGIYLSVEDYERLQKKDVRGDIKRIKERIEKFIKKAEAITDELDEAFTFLKFKEKFYSKRKPTDFIGYADTIIESIRKEGRASTASSYQCAITSIKKYIGVIDKHGSEVDRKRILLFNDLTSKWLEDFETHLEEEGKSQSTIGIYLRPVRAIFNKAMSDGLVSKKLYPFGKGGYVIPSSENKKKALKKEELKRLLNYKPKASSLEDKALDLWKFSFFCQGINVKDLCLLKWKDVSDESIEFIRAKTERSTKSNQRKISVYRLPEINDILKKRGNKTLDPNSYVFPFLDGTEGSEEQYQKIQRVTKSINKGMAKVGEKLGFTEKVTTYWARHTHATILNNMGANLSFIQEALGHKNINTTMKYLDSLPSEEHRKMAEKVVDFAS